MATKKLDAIEILLSDARGIYIPRDFAQCIDWSQFNGIDENDMSELLKGPSDCEHYWEIWEDVLNSATIERDGHTWHLSQDGDLFLMCYELMTNEERVNHDMEPLCMNCKGEMIRNTDSCTYICGSHKPYQNICGEKCWEEITTHETVIDEQIDDREDEFSTSSCDSCGSELGGERWYRVRVAFTEPEHAKLVDVVCCDCRDSILE